MVVDVNRQVLTDSLVPSSKDPSSSPLNQFVVQRSPKTLSSTSEFAPYPFYVDFSRISTYGGLVGFLRKTGRSII